MSVPACAAQTEPRVRRFLDNEACSARFLQLFSTWMGRFFCVDWRKYKSQDHRSFFFVFVLKQSALVVFLLPLAINSSVGEGIRVVIAKCGNFDRAYLPPFNLTVKPVFAYISANFEFTKIAANSIIYTPSGRKYMSGLEIRDFKSGLSFGCPKAVVLFCRDTRRFPCGSALRFSRVLSCLQKRFPGRKKCVWQSHGSTCTTNTYL